MEFTYDKGPKVCKVGFIKRPHWQRHVGILALKHDEGKIHNAFNGSDIAQGGNIAAEL